MATTKLSQATYVTRGYGQVEPNHLSAQRTAQIYAQLPAAADITVLENGQFVKYDYAKGEVNFTNPTGEWMLVFNEVKIYRDYETDADFAMVKSDYAARVYSPIDGENPTYANARRYGEHYNEDIEQTVPASVNPSKYTPDATNNPFVVEQFKSPKLMKDGTNMVPRVFKTNVGDIFTTNCINATDEEAAVGKLFKVGATGILEAGEDEKMTWQVVKVYTLPDRQKAVKLMRIV